MLLAGISMTRRRARRAAQSHRPERLAARAAFLLRQHFQPDLPRDVANAIIETEEVESGYRRACHEHRCEVNRIERAYRISRKRLPRTLDDLRANSENMPVPRCNSQVGASIGRLGLVQLAESGSTVENAIAFNKRQIRRHYGGAFGQRLTNGCAGLFVQ